MVWTSWTPNQFISDSTVLNPIVNPPASQYYYFTVQYSTCITVDSVVVNVLNSPGATVSADTNTFCHGDSVQLFGIGGLGGAHFTWSPSQGLSDPNVFNPWANPQDTTTYTLIVEEGGCRDTTDFTLFPIEGPVVGYLSSQPQGCVPFDVSFLELFNNAQFFTWNFGDGSISNDHNPIHTFTQPGTYTVSLTGWNTGSCKSTLDDIVISVKDTAHAKFVSDPGWPAQIYLPGSEVTFTDQSANAWAWTWIFGDGLQSSEKNPVHRFLAPGEYYVTLSVTNDIGCRTEVTGGPYIVLEPEVFIPNVFSPNGDPQNEEFLVRYNGDQPFLLKIFDRWGNLLFESRDKYSGWNGKFKGNDVQTGVYYYVVKTGSREYTGNVTLVR
jgi:gliding motility-associated-like protein